MDSSKLDIPLLESALNAPFASFGDDEIYPTIQDKAAVLFFRVTNNHSLLDGNKRLGVLTFAYFCTLNKYTVYESDKKLIRVSINIASGAWSEDKLKRWTREHIRKNK